MHLLLGAQRTGFARTRATPSSICSLAGNGVWDNMILHPHVIDTRSFLPSPHACMGQPPQHIAAATLASGYSRLGSTYQSETFFLRQRPLWSTSSLVHPLHLALVEGYLHKLCEPRGPSLTRTNLLSVVQT